MRGALKVTHSKFVFMEAVAATREKLPQDPSHVTDFQANRHAKRLCILFHFSIVGHPSIRRTAVRDSDRCKNGCLIGWLAREKTIA